MESRGTTTFFFGSVTIFEHLVLGTTNINLKFMSNEPLKPSGSYTYSLLW
jgi:hypothetical protein